MKKTILSVLMLALVLSASSFNTKDNPPNSVTTKTIAVSEKYFTLIMHDVNIVLTNDESTGIRVEGDEAAVKSLSLSGKDGELTVRGKSRFAGRNKLTVYVPATMLTNIQLNGHSLLSSAEPLQNFSLDILINGFCKIDLKSFGQVNVEVNEIYEYYQTRK